MNVFIIIAVIFIVIGILLTKRIINPLTIFNFIWGFVLLLYQLRISSLQSELSDETINVLIICIVSFSIAFIVSYCFKYSLKKEKESNKKNLTYKYSSIRNIFIFWIIIEIIETIYSKGLPIIWSITGSSRTYFDYGIPTIHGLMNSIGLVIVMMAFYSYLYNKKMYNVKNKKLIYIIIFIMMFYLILITRQVIISAIIQMVIIYMFFMDKIPWGKLAILLIVVIISFGIIGSIRTGYESFLSVAMIDTDINPLFVGIYWIYMYLTMTIANVNNAVNLGITGYGAFNIFKTFLPTVISNILFSETYMEMPNILVTQAFNVSGFFIDFYTGFGNVGVCIISAIYGLLGGIILKKLDKNKNQSNILYYSIYIQIIALSFFYNHLLYLPSGFQFVVIYMIDKFNKKSGNEEEKNEKSENISSVR